jgi:hypothetical protein
VLVLHRHDQRQRHVPHRLRAFTSNQGGANAGLKISGKVSGNFAGGSHIEGYASSNAPSTGLVPSTVSGDSPSTANWYQQAFPSGTVFSGPANLIDWSWICVAPNTCEQRVDAYNQQRRPAPTVISPASTCADRRQTRPPSPSFSLLGACNACQVGGGDPRSSTDHRRITIS